MINPRIIRWIPAAVVGLFSLGNLALAYFRGREILKKEKESKND